MENQASEAVVNTKPDYSLDTLVRNAYVASIKRNKGMLQHVAKELGVNRRTVYRNVHRFSLEAEIRAIREESGFPYIDTEYKKYL